MAEIINIQQLPDFVRSDVVRFIEQLIAVHQGNVISVAVYGSAASGNFIPKVSDVNVVAVVNKLDF
jgi:predicted nucleotidyltransferase